MQWFPTASAVVRIRDGFAGEAQTADDLASRDDARSVRERSRAPAAARGRARGSCRAQLRPRDVSDASVQFEPSTRRDALLGEDRHRRLDKRPVSVEVLAERALNQRRADPVRLPGAHHVAAAAHNALGR